MSLLPALDRYTTHNFLAAKNLADADDAVSSVFAIMLGLPATQVSSATEPAEPDRRTAIVGFSGSLRGSCELRLSSLAARAVTSAMLGGTTVEDEAESIDDAIGELCNIIAGDWKNRVAVLASKCSLSPPTVICGCDYRVHTNSAAVKFVRNYAFTHGGEDHTLQLTLRCHLCDAFRIG